jgi:hypothetical protein
MENKRVPKDGGGDEACGGQTRTPPKTPTPPPPLRNKNSVCTNRRVLLEENCDLVVWDDQSETCRVGGIELFAEERREEENCCNDDDEDDTGGRRRSCLGSQARANVDENVIMQNVPTGAAKR